MHTRMSYGEPTFRLFANCIPVKGARRSVICDLQLGRYDFIPNGLFRILTELRGLTIAEIKDLFDADQQSVIDGYFEFLRRERYGFDCRDPELFPELDLTWNSSAKVTNAIIDINSESNHPFAEIFQQLDALGCRALQLRCFATISLHDLRNILKLTLYGGLRDIDLLIRYSDEFASEILEAICGENQRVSRIVVHASQENKSIKVKDTGVRIVFTTANCDSPECCGQTSAKYFAVNMELFTEAQAWNSCLNRKISISADGLIRNCPSMPYSFGHVRTTPLSAVLAASRFTQIWSITKDQIKVCRDCEFRYICTDCRAYRQDAADLNSKPLKCGYDPYSAEWSDGGM
ncbi:MAG TPA: grasp-with-spasm system SPASM domain peptide maturase [Blastocatellia bacterium]|nr:grasp-with-spasm system SPASM domain peptide maturase [Blastocatellia bacterium]